MSTATIFSAQATLYAKYRPEYPSSLAGTIAALCPTKGLAWDCGTGSGQFAKLLSPYFTEVVGTDASAEQLHNAVALPNIQYRCVPAEQPAPFSTHSVDLVTVAQALHWFEFQPFFAEVRRVCRPNAVFAAITYGVAVFEDPVINQAFLDFYNGVVGPYWDANRSHVDSAYATIPFPFDRIPVHADPIRYCWAREDFLGYLRTWSAVQHYRNDKGCDPVEEHAPALISSFGEATHCAVEFPVVVLCGSVNLTR